MNIINDGGASGVIVIVAGIGHRDTIAFHISHFTNTLNSRAD